MNVEVPRERIEAFCRKWKIREFALFGSVLRDDFRPDSDVDVMVSFAPEADHSLFDLTRMEEELEELFGRRVDLVEKAAVVNPFVRHHIRNHHRVLYAA
ncbi:MAG TPA: nucleotidyltransferase family protein [Longimicrobium sp.]|nr:nucleotidyltransferase family protein [Longimicrobium sp.]